MSNITKNLTQRENLQSKMKTGQQIFNYKIIGQKSSHLYGTLYKVSNKNLDNFYIASSDFRSEEFDLLFKKLTILKNCSCPNLMKLVDFSVILNSTRHNSHTTHQIFEFQEENLIDLSKNSKFTWTSYYLFKLLYDMIEVGKSLNEMGFYVGYFGISAIYFQKENFKLMPLLITELSSIESFTRFIKFNKYLVISPELRLKTHDKSQILDKDIRKSDVFALGATIIGLGLEIDLNKEIFQKDDCWSILSKYFSLFEKKFKDSRLLVSTVKTMINENKKKRPTFAVLKTSLPDFRLITNYYEQKKEVSQSMKKSEQSKLTPSFKSEESGKNQGSAKSFKPFVEKKMKDQNCFPDFNVSRISKQEDLREEDQQLINLLAKPSIVFNDSRLKLSEVNAEFSFSIKSKKDNLSSRPDVFLEGDSGREFIYTTKTRSQNSSFTKNKNFFKKVDRIFTHVGKNVSTKNEKEGKTDLEMFFTLENDENSVNSHRRTGSDVFKMNAKNDVEKLKQKTSSNFRTENRYSFKK